MKKEPIYVDLEYNSSLGKCKIRAQVISGKNPELIQVVTDFNKFLDKLDPEIYNEAVEKYANTFDIKEFSDLMQSDFVFDLEPLKKCIIVFKVIVRDIICDKIFNLLKDKISLEEELGIQLEPDHSFNTMLEQAMQSVEECINFAELNGLTDEQDFINWEDDLNMYSCKEHPECPHDFIKE